MKDKEVLLLYKEIDKSIDSAPLSQTMRLVIRLARQLGDNGLEKWARLELGGYFNDNPAISSDVRVPEYRNIAGQYKDIYGRRLVLQPNLQFFNTYYLRQGIEELEKLASSSDNLTVQDDNYIQSIQESLQVQVHIFVFNPTAVIGVLSAIRMVLEDRLVNLQKSRSLSQEKSDQDYVSEDLKDNQHVTIIIAGNVSNSNVAVGKSITSSINILESSSIDDDLRIALGKLTGAVNSMVGILDEEKAEHAARDLEMLTAEATSGHPRKEWWQLSLDGLVSAAKNVGDVGKPILELAILVASLLSKR